MSVKWLQTLPARASLLRALRTTLDTAGFIEVETPVRIPAPANEPYIIPPPSGNAFLRASPELQMKRLLALGFEKIYQLGPCFRADERGNKHNPEFTMLEWYRPGFDLEALAAELSDLLTTVYGQSQNLTYYSYSKAFIDYVGIHPLTASLETIKAAAEKNALGGLDLGEDRQGWLDVLFSHLVEPNLGYQSPTLITDYPPATAALAKVETDEQGNEVAKRFELYINGIEIANAYDELADGAALQARFEADNEERARRGLPIMPIDERLVAACDHLPACSGIALGIDRLLMVVTGAKSIDEVIGFGIGRA